MSRWQIGDVRITKFVEKEFASSDAIIAGCHATDSADFVFAPRHWIRRDDLRPSTSPRGSPSCAGPVIEQTPYFAKPGLADRVYEQRIHASCRFDRRLGCPAGRVFRPSGWSRGELSDVIWQLEYTDQQALNPDLEVRAQSREFEEVRATMRTLIDKFKRGVCRPPCVDRLSLTDSSKSSAEGAV